MQEYRIVNHEFGYFCHNSLEFMHLHIDTTTDRNKLVLTWPSGKEKVLSWQIKHGSTEGLLNQIDKFLKQNKIDLKDLQRISANSGPGSFVGTRVGVSVANTLSWSFGIPDYPIMPVYGRPPNITRGTKDKVLTSE